MSTEQVSGGGVPSVREVLDLTLAQAREADRDDLVLRLSAARRLLLRRTLEVRVTGGAGQGKSALIEALTLSPTLDAVTYQESRSTPPEGPGSVAGRDVELSHVVLFVSDAAGSLTEAEVEQLRGIQDWCPNIVLVLTKLDLYEGGTEVLAQNQTLLSEAGISVEMCAVSAVWRLRAQWSGDQEHATQSGIPALRSELAVLGADVERAAVQAGVAHTLAALGELDEMLRLRHARLSATDGLERARTQLNLVERRVEALRASIARFPSLLSGGCATVASDAALDLRQRMQGVYTELDRALECSHPDRGWAGLTSWLKNLLSFEVGLNREFAIVAGAHVSATVAAQLGVAQPHQLSAARAPTPVVLPPLPDPGTALPKTSPVNLTAGVGIVMKAWVGFAMFFTVVAVARLHVARELAVVPILLLITIGGFEERRRWLARRRSHASTALRGYVGDVTVQANKQLTDLMRSLEAELREVYGGWLEREQDTLATTHTRAQRELRELEHSPKLLADIEDRLRDYTALRRRSSAIIPARLLAS